MLFWRINGEDRASEFEFNILRCVSGANLLVLDGEITTYGISTLLRRFVVNPSKPYPSYGNMHFSFDTEPKTFPGIEEINVAGSPPFARGLIPAGFDLFISSQRKHAAKIVFQKQYPDRPELYSTNYTGLFGPRVRRYVGDQERDVILHVNGTAIEVPQINLALIYRVNPTQIFLSAGVQTDHPIQIDDSPTAENTILFNMEHLYIHLQGLQIHPESVFDEQMFSPIKAMILEEFTPRLDHVSLQSAHIAFA